jgi:predicted porin
MPNSDQTDTRSFVNGFVRVAGATIAAGLLHRSNIVSPTPTSNAWFLDASFPIDLFTLDAQIARIKFKDSLNGASLIAARVVYNLSKRSAVYLTSGRIFNKGNSTFTIDGGNITGSTPLPGVAQSGVMAGLRHMF